MKPFILNCSKNGMAFPVKVHNLLWLNFKLGYIYLVLVLSRTNQLIYKEYEKKTGFALLKFQLIIVMLFYQLHI